MTMYEPRYGASYVKKAGQSSPENLLRRIRRENKNLDWDTEENIFHQAVLEDPDMMRACTRWVHTGAARNIERIDEAPDAIKAERQYHARKKGQGAQQRKAKKVIEHILLNKVRYMTGAECAAAAKSSKGLAKLAKLVKPEQMVGDAMSDERIVKILRGQ